MPRGAATRNRLSFDSTCLCGFVRIANPKSAAVASRLKILEEAP